MGLDFKHYLPYLKKDDFLGINNYTRKVIDKNGRVITPEGAELTDQGYEYYPEGLGNAIRKVAKELHLPIIVTENGVATIDDTRRLDFIQRALRFHNRVQDPYSLILSLNSDKLVIGDWQVKFSQI